MTTKTKGTALLFVSGIATSMVVAVAYADPSPFGVGASVFCAHMTFIATLTILLSELKS